MARGFKKNGYDENGLTLMTESLGIVYVTISYSKFNQLFRKGGGNHYIPTDLRPAAHWGFKRSEGLLWWSSG